MRISLRLQRSEARPDGRCPVYLTLRYKDRRAVLGLAALGLRPVKPSDWNANRSEVRAGVEGRTRANEILAHVMDTAREVQREEAFTVSARELRDKIRDRLFPVETEAPAEIDFATFCRSEIERHRVRGQISTSKSKRSVFHKFMAYARPREDPDAAVLPFAAVTPAFCAKWYDWLVSPGGAANSVNTAAKAIRTMRALFNEALRQRVVPPPPEDDEYAARYWLTEPNPFKLVRAPTVPVEKRKMKADEIRRLFTADLPKGPRRDARDAFALAFYAGGMRFGDVATLRRKHVRYDGEDWRLGYRMGKTKDLYWVLLTEEAMTFFERIARPGWRDLGGEEFVTRVLAGRRLDTPEQVHKAVNAANSNVNNLLTKTAAALGLPYGPGGERPNLSFHLSRHGLGGWLLEQGYDIRTIQRIYGHSSVAITEAYLTGYESRFADEAMRGLRLLGGDEEE